MPMHDWTRVDASIFHAHHHAWISELSRSLNKGRLPKDYYALPEQQAAGFGPDVLTLQSRSTDDAAESVDNDQPTSTMTRVRPKTRFVMESPTEFYRRKKKAIAIRHVSNDDLVAMIEIVSPGNKSSSRAFTQFVEKACYLLEHQIHLLLIDPFPPGKRDPQGVHAAIWDEIEASGFQLPRDKPLTVVSYECDVTTRAYVEPFAVGDSLLDMPLFLQPGEYVTVPLEQTYANAYAVMPGGGNGYCKPRIPRNSYFSNGILVIRQREAGI